MISAINFLNRTSNKNTVSLSAQSKPLTMKRVGLKQDMFVKSVPAFKGNIPIKDAEGLTKQIIATVKKEGIKAEFCRDTIVGHYTRKVFLPIKNCTLENANLEGFNIAKTIAALKEENPVVKVKGCLSDGVPIGDHTAAGILNWAESIIPEFRDVNLKGASLKGANLHRSFIVGSDLTGANLEKAVLDKSLLLDSDFSKANLNHARLWNCDARSTQYVEADLKGANFFGSDLSEANFEKADIAGANFARTYLPKSKFNGVVDAKNASFADAQIEEATLTNSNFAKANFENAKLCHSDMSNSNFEKANFNKADLFYVNLKDSVIKGSKTTDTNLRGAQLPRRLGRPRKAE